MATKFISCPRCEGRSEIIRTTGTSVARERCNVCIETPGTLEIVCKPASAFSDQCLPASRCFTEPPLTEAEDTDAHMTQPQITARADWLTLLGVYDDGKSGISWNGYRIAGNTKSIAHVRQLISDAHYKSYFQALLVKDRDELTRLRAAHRDSGTYVSPLAG